MVTSFYALLVIQDHRPHPPHSSLPDIAGSNFGDVKVRQRVEELRSSQHFIQQIADSGPYFALHLRFDRTAKRHYGD
jgi:hypothetical protein